MKSDNHRKIEEKVQKALDFIEQDSYKTNPFLYTRIKQRLANKQATENRQSTTFSISILWKPALAIFLVALNGYVLLGSQNISGNANILAEEYGWMEHRNSADCINYE